MDEDIEILTSNKGDVSVISIKGNVTALTGDAIEEAYHKASKDGSKKILLSFNNDNYINSGGIAFLIGIVAEGKENEQVVRLSGLSEHFQKIFKMVGITRYAKIYSSVDAAVNGWWE